MHTSPCTVFLTCHGLGHKLAWEVAGVLHRDISVGNILITDEAVADGCHGFIHDFDYSYMESRIPPGEVDDEASLASEDPDDSRKERLVRSVHMQQLPYGL